MKEIELVRSGLLVDMPHSVLDYRIVDVLEALDKRLTALEGDGEDNTSIILDHELRLDDLETLHYRGKYPARHNYIEPVHNESKPLACCEGCAGWPCETSQILKGDAPGWTPTCYREKHICGECGKYEGCSNAPACPDFEAIQ